MGISAGTLDHAFELMDVERLAQDVGRAERARLREQGRRAAGGHEHDRRPWRQVPNPREQRQIVESGRR